MKSQPIKNYATLFLSWMLLSFDPKLSNLFCESPAICVNICTYDYHNPSLYGLILHLWVVRQGRRKVGKSKGASSNVAGINCSHPRLIEMRTSQIWGWVTPCLPSPVLTALFGNLGYELGKSLLGWLMIPSDPFFYRLLLLVVTFFIPKMIDY